MAMTSDELDDWAKSKADEVFHICTSQLKSEIKKQTIFDALKEAYRSGTNDALEKK
jgi:hypothetical protein